MSTFEGAADCVAHRSASGCTPLCFTTTAEIHARDDPSTRTALCAFFPNVLKRTIASASVTQSPIPESISVGTSAVSSMRTAPMTTRPPTLRTPTRDARTMSTPERSSVP